jgi:CDP-diacylglycerol---glycerol-3-phosphate 3-phosphatidyltransferase
VIIGVDQRLGAIVLLVGGALDAVDSAVARARGTSSTYGAFFDSVADRIADVVVFGTALWLVRDEPLLFGVGLAALGGAQVTSYIRAKAESLGWNATVGVLERAERIIIMGAGFIFDLLAVALWVIAIGALVTIVQRWRAVARQAERPAVGGS